jgi:hypothetical protein
MAKVKVTKKLKISSGAMTARAKFEEAKHKRDTGGKFADKPGEGGAKKTTTDSKGAQPGAGSGGASTADWQAAGKTSGVVGEDQIKLHVTANPKKAGSASADRFAKYQDGMTADDFIAAGGTREDLAWDRKKGFISIHEPATYAKLSGSPGSATAEINELGATGRLAAIKDSVEKPPSKLAEVEGTSTAPKPPGEPKPEKQVKEPELPKPEKKAEKTTPETTSTTPTQTKPKGDTKPMLAPPGEKVTDDYVTSSKPLKVELPKKMPPDHKYKATELTPLPQTSMADEAEKGLKWEYEVEYKKYGGEKWGPGIKDQEDFNKRYKAAPLTYLTDEQYNNLGYTSINMNNLPTFNDVHKQIGHRRDPKAIQDRMFNGITTPPIVLRKKNQLRLMAGQSRIFTGFASGFRVPVKVLDV